MPVGQYTVMDGEGRPVGREEFRCAPGPAGWRWFSTVETSVPTPHREIVDYTVDGEWRPVRLRIDTGEHDVLLTAQDGRLAGSRDGQPMDLPRRDDLDYLSPCFNAVTANRIKDSAEVEPLFLEPVTLEPRPVAQRYERLGEETVNTPVGRFAATAWRYTAVQSGWTARLWVAGDVVVAYEGLFELTEYEPGPRGPFPLP